MGIYIYIKGPHSTFLINSKLNVGTMISFLVDKNLDNQTIPYEI